MPTNFLHQLGSNPINPISTDNINHQNSQLAVLTPAEHNIWAVLPEFKMQPGLSRLEPEQPELFLTDNCFEAYQKQRLLIAQSHLDQAQIGLLSSAVLQKIVEIYQQNTKTILSKPINTALELALLLQEDFVVLNDSEQGMVTEFLSVFFPSNWNPSEKWGLDFAAIHAPVADNTKLLAGAKGIMDLAFRKKSMMRHVWLLTPSADLPQHPSIRRNRWEDLLQSADASGTSLLEQVFYRVERQTTLPLPEIQKAVFFIRVMVSPLIEMLRQDASRVTELSMALSSMTDAVVEYRGMTLVRDRLVTELAQLITHDT